MNENVLVSRGELSTIAEGWNVPITGAPCGILKPENEERADVGLGLCTEKLLGGAQSACVDFFCAIVGGVPNTVAGAARLLKKEASLESPMISRVYCSDKSTVPLVLLLAWLLLSPSVLPLSDPSESLQHRCSRSAIQLLISSVSEDPLESRSPRYSF